MNTPLTTDPQSYQTKEVLLTLGSSPMEAGGAMSEDLYALIAQQPFFKGLDPHQLQLLADSAMRMHFEAGQSIFEEGSPANRFYLILEGAVALESEVKDRGRITIQTLGCQS